MNETLPKGWYHGVLKEILHSIKTGVPEFKGQKKYYSTGSVEGKTFVPEGEFSYNNRPSRANRMAIKDDIFQARMKETDKGLIVDDRLSGQLFSTGFLQLRPYSETYLSQLLYYYIISPSFLNQKDELATGSTQEALTDTNAVKLIFPLPPLNEQKRITAKLDKIIPRIGAVKERLYKVPAIINRFRQSVLTAAATGKLTEMWREEHPEVESAESLLDKTREIKHKKYEDECKEAKHEKKRKPLPYFFDTSPKYVLDNMDLPESWQHTSLGNISYVQGGLQKTPKRKPVNNFYKYITVANVYRGFLKLDDLSSFEATNKEFFRLKLEKNDLLIVEGNGSAKEIGRCAIWNNEIKDCIHQNHIIRSRPIEDVINSKYSLLFFNSNFGIKIMMDVASTTSGLYTLSVSKVNNLPIPLPPIEEQKEIVRQADKLFAIADKLETHYRNAKVKVDKISQSVLAKAFRGELVPQDPNDEPAEKLLERIQAKKAKMEVELKKAKQRLYGFKR